VSDEYSFDCAAACGQPLRFGTYRVLDRIAEGGMGLIFRGQDMRSGRLVAIKTVRSRRDADAAAIRREIITLAQLRHPGIVRLHTYDAESGVPWMALELLEGRTLGDEISWYWPETSTGAGGRRARTDELPTTPACGLRDRTPNPARSPFPVAGGGHLLDAFPIVTQICLALDHVHRHGLVHRDVKPANVFLGNDGRTTLLDFGLACAAAATRENEVGVGTMEYAAPEQICGGPVDRRADIYSLGCVLYELVTGRLPFRGDSASEIAARQIKREAVAPSALSADVPGQLDDLVMSMLAKTPAHRPDSATEVGWRLANIARRVSQRHVLSVDDAHHRFRQAG
jgi:serine/threonine protein kinase